MRTGSQRTMVAWVTAVAVWVGAAAEAKMPAGALHQLKEVDRSLAQVDRALGPASVASAKDRADTARAAIGSARDTLAEIAKRYAAQIPSDAPEMKAAADRIAQAEGRLAAFEQTAAQGAAAAAETRAQADAWVQKLQPYVLGTGQPGHDPTRYLVAGATSELEELARRRNIHALAAAALADFDKAGPKDLPDDLAEVVRQLRYAVKTFGESFQTFAEQRLVEAERRAAELDVFLKQQEAAPAGQGLFPEKDQLANLGRLVDTAAAVAVPDAPRIAALRTRQADLLKRDAALRAARVAQTRMTPDRYRGGDLAALKRRAEEIVAAKLPDAKVLRTTLISESWKQESVIEATDTTHTALRFRTTRSLTAQVAAKQDDAARLHTLDLSQDRQAGGAWGPVYGHIMFTDGMLERNVE